MVDAIDPFKFARTQALQQSPSRLSPPTPAFGGADALPKLKNGPDADTFVSSAKPTASASPMFGNATQKSGPATFLQNMRDLVSKVTQPNKVQGTPKMDAPSMTDAARKPAVPPQFAGGKKVDVAAKTFDQAAERMASATSGATANRFSDVNVKLQQQKKNIVGVSAALPLFGMAALMMPVVAPTAMVVKPAMINQIVSVLPTTFP